MHRNINFKKIFFWRFIFSGNCLSWWRRCRSSRRKRRLNNIIQLSPILHSHCYFIRLCFIIIDIHIRLSNLFPFHFSSNLRRYWWIIFWYYILILDFIFIANKWKWYLFLLKWRTYFLCNLINAEKIVFINCYLFIFILLSLIDLLELVLFLL